MATKRRLPRGKRAVNIRITPRATTSIAADYLAWLRRHGKRHAYVYYHTPHEIVQTLQSAGIRLSWCNEDGAIVVDDQEDAA